MSKSSVKTKKEKKNNIFKNIGIVINALFKKYPSAWIIIPLLIIARIASPFLNTLLSSKAVAEITKGDIKSFFIVTGILLLSINVCMAISNIAGSFFQMQKMYTRLGKFSQDLLSKTLYTDFKNIELQKNQKLLGKAVQSINSNWNGSEELLNQSLNITVTFLGIGTYGAFVLTIDWKILVAIICMFIGNITLQSAAIRYSDKNREKNSELWRKKNYIVQKSTNNSAGKDIRLYQLQNWFCSIFDKIIIERRKYHTKIQLHWYFPTLSDVFFNFIRDWLAYSIIIRRVLAGEMDAATATLYIGMVSNFSNWIYSLANNFNRLRRASHEFNDYYDFMNLPERDVPEVLNKHLKLSEAPQIEFKNVQFTYDDAEKPTIQNLNFTIKPGEKIALVGNNGAGKTTIVKLLTGLYKQTGGEILINGNAIEEIGLEKYQDIISVLFQDTNPLSFTLKENIASNTSGDSKKVWESIKLAGLEDKINSLENKENTFITQNLDEKGILLSGGETQKLLLAKAIYKNGNLLILDEPTSALDPLAESKIYEEYNNMAFGKTAIFISHRLASTKFCDKIMFLENGQIIEYGTHTELIKKGGKYKEIFDIQSQYYVNEKTPEQEVINEIR